MPEIAEDGRSLVFILGSARSPHAQASRLEAKGSIAVLRASETSTREVDVVFQDGASFDLGPFEFEITEVGMSEWSENWNFELSSKKDLASIVSYSLVTGGEEKELRRSMSMNGMGTWTQTLEHEQPLETGTLRIEYWSDPATIELPFSVSAGLGLR
jgi:hypothetical protein